MKTILILLALSGCSTYTWGYEDVPAPDANDGRYELPDNHGVVRGNTDAGVDASAPLQDSGIQDSNEADACSPHHHAKLLSE